MSTPKKPAIPEGLRILDQGNKPAPASKPEGIEANPGQSLDWTDEPESLRGYGLEEWRRMAKVYELDDDRFREGYRRPLEAYCTHVGHFLEAADIINRDGLLVAGRSSADQARGDGGLVKNPAAQIMRDASIQIRYYARELGLTPASSGQLKNGPGPAHDEDNPF